VLIVSQKFDLECKLQCAIRTGSDFGILSVGRSQFLRSQATTTCEQGKNHMVKRKRARIRKASAAQQQASLFRRHANVARGRLPHAKNVLKTTFGINQGSTNMTSVPTLNPDTSSIATWPCDQSQGRTDSLFAPSYNEYSPQSAGATSRTPHSDLLFAKHPPIKRRQTAS